MSKTYNYQTSSVEDIAQRFRTISNQAYSKLCAYYEQKNDDTMLAKIQQARHLSKILNLQAGYEELYCNTLDGVV